MIGCGQGVRDLHAFYHWQEDEVGKRQVYNRGAGLSDQGEPSIFLRRVEKGEAGLYWLLEVWEQGADFSE